MTESFTSYVVVCGSPFGLRRSGVRTGNDSDGGFEHGEQSTFSTGKPPVTIVPGCDALFEPSAFDLGSP